MLSKERSGNKYPLIISQIIPMLESQGYQNFRAEVPNYDDPNGFTLQNSDELRFVPDLSARKNDKKTYFDIASKKSDPQKLISKWKLLSTMANLRQGNFKIVAPRGTVLYTRGLLEKYQINAELVRV